MALCCRCRCFVALDGFVFLVGRHGCVERGRLLFAAPRAAVFDAVETKHVPEGIYTRMYAREGERERERERD